MVRGIWVSKLAAVAREREVEMGFGEDLEEDILMGGVKLGKEGDKRVKDSIFRSCFTGAFMAWMGLQVLDVGNFIARPLLGYLKEMKWLQ
ncbi:conserved hypothetical protein [Ricinus communis]|uniref:Uncharacterized protein n=1 Tax=Ricinus communis TaxID=3988 RepID=B9RF40_RICCO|nr:conserved hypothetical protein [Ricinus communis]